MTCLPNTPRAFGFPNWQGRPLFALLSLILLLAVRPLSAQDADPLAQQLAASRVAQEQLNFLRQSQQITDAEYQARNRELGTQLQSLRTLIAKQPRDQQTQIMQQQESLFQVRIVPLREQWREALQEKRQADDARNAQIQKEMIADAETAGKLQAERAILAERQRRGEISQADFQQQDQAAQQQVMVLQQKYDADGGNWGRVFSQNVANDAQKAAADARLQARLDDTQSPIGQDAHRAAEINLSIQRDAVFLAQRAMTLQQARAQDTNLQAELAAINARHGRGAPDAADYNDRVFRLVQAGTAEQKSQWLLEAESARAAAASNRPATNTGRQLPASSALGTPPHQISRVRQPYRPLPPSMPQPNASAPAASPLPWAVPANPFNAPQRPPTAGLSIVILFLLLAMGGGYYLFQRHRQRPASPNYADLKVAQRASALPTSKPAPAPLASPSEAGPPRPLKERMFAEQRGKYQTLYNDAADEVTAASAELAQCAGVIEGVQNNLTLLSKAVYDRVHALIQNQNLHPARIVLKAALLVPFFRMFRSRGIFPKLVFVGVMFWLGWRVWVLLAAGQLFAVIVLGMIAFAICFFVELSQQTNVPLNALQKENEQVAKSGLVYVYADQTALSTPNGPYFGAMRVSVSAKNRIEEVTVEAGADLSRGPGTFLVGFGNLAVFRIDNRGNIAAEFCRAYCAELAQALGEQKAFMSKTLPALAAYGQAMRRKRESAARLPQMESLVKDVTHMEALWRDTYTSDKVFEFLQRRIDLFNMRDPATPPGILLYGYAGNGKAHLARLIAASTSARLEQVNPLSLASPGEVKALWNKSRGKDPVVLFVDTAERAFPRPGSENQGAGTREGTLAFGNEWAMMEAAQSRVWVVMTAQGDQELHPDILKLFGRSKIEVSSPDAAGREIILRNACRGNQLPVALPNWLVAATSGVSVRELNDIVRETKLLCVPNPPTDSHWREALKNVRGPDTGNEGKTWDDLVLPPEIKAQLQSACRILVEADRYKAKGLKVPNILLYGPPGTGKTEIARTMASQGGFKFLALTIAEIKGDVVGQSARLVKASFAKARAMAPAVLFIDEIEALTGHRGSRESDSYSHDIVNEMNQQMDGVRNYDKPVCVLAATNLREQIDRAILDRFTRTIEIPLPDEAGRREILKRLIKRNPVDPNLDIEEISTYLAKRLNRKSGRELVMLVSRAMERAVGAGDSPDDIILTRQMLVAEVTPQVKEVSDADLQKEWSQVVLKPEVKESILNNIRLFNRGDKAAPRGLLLYGPPGTGKTEIAKRIAGSTSSHFMSLTASDLKASHVGESLQAVKKVWEQARAHGRSVIFIDECDTVFGARQSFETDSFIKEVVGEFLASWDGVASEGQIWVVGATNQRQSLDDAIVSRFGAAVEIGLPGAPERLAILRLELQKLERQADIPGFVGASTTGFAGRELAQMAREVCALANQRNSAITPDMWQSVIARYTKDGSDAVDETARWDSLVLPEPIIRKFQTTCRALQQIEIILKQGMTPPRAALLYGPPGTGKTQIARTLANESKLPFIAAGPSDLKSGWVGRSGPKVHELFEEARKKAPCILFIDEVDAAFPKRDGANTDQFTPEIVNQALTELDGVKKNDRFVFLLAATNRLELVDDAFLSRIEDRISIPYPDAQQRRRLLQILIARKPVNFDVEKVSVELAAMIGDVSGRDLRNLVERASQVALERALDTDTVEHVVLCREDLLSQVATV